MDNPLESTRRFWNRSPCDGQEDYRSRYRIRYAKEPWILREIIHIAGRFHHILEMGCGQGTDALSFCRLLPHDGSYTGIDISDRSVTQAVSDCSNNSSVLTIRPVFMVGDAEHPPVRSESVSCVYSFGVLHHTSDIRKALAEIHRILIPGGKAYIYLYHTLAPKVLAARAIRGFQKIIDTVFRTKDSLHRFVLKHPMEKHLGTMLIECSGVPHLNSYTRRQVEDLVREFRLVSLHSIGNNLPLNLIPFRINSENPRGPFGVFWRLELEKRENPESPPGESPSRDDT